MTHDYKAALDGIDWKFNDGSFTKTEKDTIRHALTIASEYERVKKERDELAEKLNKVVCGICNQPLTSKSDESHNCYGVHEWYDLNVKQTSQESEE